MDAPNIEQTPVAVSAIKPIWRDNFGLFGCDIKKLIWDNIYLSNEEEYLIVNNKYTYLLTTFWINIITHFH